MNTDTAVLSTADLVAATQSSESRRTVDPRAATLERGIAAVASPSDAEPLAPLFRTQEAQDFRATWNTVQIGFVDGPKEAVRQADELVAQVMKTLAESFANERSRLEGQVDQTDQVSTEDLRVALRRYRSFFQRLLSL